MSEVLTDEERAEAVVESNGAGPRPGSLLEQVRQQLQEDTEAEHLDLRLPRKQPALVARYRVTQPEEYEDVVGDDVISRNVAMLVKACEGLFGFQGGKKVPLEDEQGRPVTYANVAQVLGFESESARQTIMYLFKENEIALLTHGDRVITWMQDTSQEVEGQVLGESLA